ncbi:hypothetical protein [Legionella spiritensis]|uniref:hypothetical protein n=1 Tax=Legionella spiritensis TaxID=452 RepID=UPI000F6C94EA|nr:hypothetical protein [Legionella spiritensis]VEG92140.1 Uncharacterised protein [Legionella spiritensis]
MTREVLEKWLQTKKKWEDIFSLRVPRPEDLLDLMDDWSSFRQLSIGLFNGTAKIHGSDIFFLDAREFLQSACKFFDVPPEEKNLPLVRNLQEKLIEASTKVHGKSALSVIMFKDRFPKAVNEAIILKQQRREEEARLRQEKRKQEINDQVEQDPFFTALRGIQEKIEGEINRINLKNPNDDRLTHLNKVHDLMQNQADTTKENCKNDHLNNRGSNQENIKSECKDEMTKIIKTHLIDNNALDMSWREKIGRAILNVIIALPVKLYSKYSNAYDSNLFFKFNTQSKTNIEQIQEDIENIDTTVKKNK